MASINLTTLEFDNYPRNATLNDTSDSTSVTGNINAAFMLLYFVIGFPWNVLVIGIIVKKKLYTRPSVMLLLNLAINHLLVCLLMMPVTFVLGIDNEIIYRRRDDICQTGLLFVLLLSVSNQTVALMSVDRVIYLKKPLTYERIVTPWRMFFATVAVWVFSITLSLPPLFGFGEVGYSPELATCGLIIRIYGPYSTILAIVGALSHLIKLFSCGYILYIIRKHLLGKLTRALGSRRGRKRSLERASGSTGDGSYESGVMKKYKENQLQLLKIFGAIFTVSILTFLPFAAGGILVPFFGESNAGPLLYVYRITYIIALSKSVIYPILELYMTREMRETFCQLFCACKPNCKKKKTPSSSNKNSSHDKPSTEGRGSRVALNLA